MPLLLFAATLFVSATLLFLVQPMIGKMLLPMLGGTPAVWNTCMVFFQALLLAGYAYAHATTALLGVRRQAALHLGVLLVPFLTLGLTIDRGLLDYGEGSPIPGLLLVLLLSVGLPFFAVSTSAPLLQKWFAGTGHPAARDPYFLYGASNLGSMLALFGYPLVVEPNLRLADQRRLWQIGYGVLVAMIAACAVCLWRSRDAEKVAGWQADGAVADGPPEATLSWTRWVYWIALAFVPSSLMLGATTYMTTDIAAIPLLWVLPLGLYLFSFILVFSRLPGWVHGLMVALLPFAVLPLVFLMLYEHTLPIAGKVAVHMAVLFVVAMVCHGELASDRPPTRYLTGFYLCMSVGGVLGGLFNALIAPVAFNGIVEYPLALVLACLLAPAPETERKSRFGPAWDSALTGLFLGAGLAFLLPAVGRSDLDIDGLKPEAPWLATAFVGAAVLVFATRAKDRDARLARWFDLALPVALGVLALGLNLGLRITTIHHGLKQLVIAILTSLPAEWLARMPVIDPDSSGILVLCIFIVPVVLCTLFINRPLRFGLAVGAVLLAGSVADLLNEDVKLRQRSFFGVLQVTDNGPFRRLEHGTTLHGMQRRRWTATPLLAGAAGVVGAGGPCGAVGPLSAWMDVALHPGREPLTYFHRTGPIGQIFAAYKDRLAGCHVGLIGLGSGTLASYGQPGQKLTYFEIDPVVKHIAYDPEYFTFVQDARNRGVDVELVLGDARLKLEERARQSVSDRLALLVVDAFSSDAIPIHLLTKQALEIYFDNLADDGLLAVHISNRYLNLEPVLGNLAQELGLVGYIESDLEGGHPGKAASVWVVLARRDQALDLLVHEGRWQQWQERHDWDGWEGTVLVLSALPFECGAAGAQGVVMRSLFGGLRAPWRKLKVRPDVGVWTDDYSNLLKVFDLKN